MKKFKSCLRNLMGVLNLNIRYAVVPGISFLGVNIFVDKGWREQPHFSAKALEYALKLGAKSVIDIGSGGGYHAEAFKKAGSKVTCVDLGTSVYAKESNVSNLNVVSCDFMEFKSDQKYDIVWASHVLEHQRNVGLFINKLIALCNPDGYVIITVPDPHRGLWGGHLTLWSPGILAYNVALCSIDLRDSIYIRGANEFTLAFKPICVNLPTALTFDKNDVNLLRPFLPVEISENSDPWKVKYQ